MLVQLYRDNYTTTPREELSFTIYNGYFDGTSTPILDPKLNFFETATVLNTGYTSNLTSLQTVTNGLYFNNVSNDPNPPSNVSIKISGFFRAKKTGTYRFFTRSDDASFLFINDAMVVNNGNTHGPENQFGNISMVAGRYYKFDVYWGESARGQWLSAGYLEPLDDGTTTNSINLNDFITNATGLTTYYDINPQTQPTQTTNAFPLVIEDDTLQGLFRVSPLALYINRTNFTSTKHQILYIASDDLFNSFNATYKTYIQVHEKPVANDNERKRFTQFSSDMSFECELNGRIEVRFRRGNAEPINWRYAMLILDVERIPVKQIS
jgi:hypothetical protein